MKRDKREVMRGKTEDKETNRKVMKKWRKIEKEAAKMKNQSEETRREEEK